jgi:predicted nucleic acid-binding protein
VTAYLDTGVLVSLLTDDTNTARAENLLAQEWPLLLVSDFTGAESAATPGRLVRTRILPKQTAPRLFALHESWIARYATPTGVLPADVELATAWLRRLDLTFRAPDAIHLAIAARRGAALLTSDRGLAAAARSLGLSVNVG